MDFFKYASVAEMFVNTDTWWVPFLVGGLCFAVVYVFQSVGLFIISGREGYKNRWMAFIPFVNTYYIGVCGQKNRVFRTVDTKILSLIAAVLEFLLVSGYVVYYVAQIELLNAGCIYEVAQEPGYGSPDFCRKEIYAFYCHKRTFPRSGNSYIHHTQQFGNEFSRFSSCRAGKTVQNVPAVPPAEYG